MQPITITITITITLAYLFSVLIDSIADTTVTESNTSEAPVGGHGMHMMPDVLVTLATSVTLVSFEAMSF